MLHDLWKGNVQAVNIPDTLCHCWWGQSA